MAAHPVSTDHLGTLRDTDRDAIGGELQEVLVVLLDLALLGKHAHWNLVGPHFRSLHLHLDEMVAEWHELADRVAERAVALGQVADGRAATVAAGIELSSLPAERIPDRDVIAAFTRLLADASGVVRDQMTRIETVDPVTADLLHDVVATLEEQLWMVRVQAA